MSIGGFDDLLSQTGALDPEEATASMSIETGSARRAERQRQRAEDEKLQREEAQGEPEDVVAEREAIAQERHEREAGDQGGSSGGGGSATPAQTSSVTGPEPRPQRDDIDGNDGNDEPDEPDEPVVPEDEEDEPEPEPVVEPEPANDDDDEEGSEVEAISQSEPEGNRAGAAPAQWKDGTKFSYGVGPVDTDGKSTEMKLSRFPKQLVANLRTMIGGHLGDAFAKEAAGNQLVTAFLAARLGIPFEADANTTRMITAFRELEPQLAELEQTTSRTEDEVAALAKANRLLTKRLGAVEELIASTELAISFFIADRIAAISTHDMTLEKAQINHPKALAMRETIRAQAKEEMTRQKRRDGVSY